MRPRELHDHPMLTGERVARRLLLLALLLAIAGFAALTVDLTVSRFLMPPVAFHHEVPPRDVVHIPGDVRKLFRISEFFAHGFGVAMIVLLVVVLDPGSRRPAVRIVCCAVAAGVSAALLKDLVPRIRPGYFHFQAGVLATFGHRGPETGYIIRSTPSAHAATATGLALALSWRYPRGTGVFAFFAALAFLQRVEGGAHYLSDTLWGASVGCLAVAPLLDSRLAGRWFDRFEAHSPD